MFHRSLELISINFIYEIDFLQLLRAGLQRLLVSNDISIVRRCISNIDIKVDCNSS